MQISDYMTYYITAQEIFTTHSINHSNAVYFSAISGTAPLISGLLSIPFSLFEIAPETILYFNVFLYSVSAVGLFLIARRLVSYILALLLSFIFAVWPNHVFSSLYILSEPLYLFFLIWGFVALVYAAEQKRVGNRALLCGISGALLCISQHIRPVTIIYLIALAFVLLTKKRIVRKKALPVIAAFLASYCITSSCIGLYTEQYLPVISKPTFGWTLYEGTNPYTWGQWSVETSEALQEVINNYPLEEVENELLNRAVLQLKEYDMRGLFELLSYKLERMWAKSNGYITDLKYLFAYTPEMIESGSLPYGMEQLGMLAQPCFTLAVLGVIAVMGLLVQKVLKQPQFMSNSGPLVLTLSLCGGMLLHCMATSIQRYNYVWIHIMLLIVFYGVEVWAAEPDSSCLSVPCDTDVAHDDGSVENRNCA